MSLLTYIIGLPLAAALLLVLVPRNKGTIIWLISALATFASMVLAIMVFVQFEAGKAGYQFPQKILWVSSLGISYHVGVDGLNVGLILMGAMVAFAAACVSWDIKKAEKEFAILLLLMSGGILGAFASLDLFFLYFFHELALVPTFIMIGVWGRGEDKNYATFQITLYLTLGALITLVGLLALYLQAGANTFDLVELTSILAAKPLGTSAQHLIFPLLLFGFGILVSLWPFHSWAPLGYGVAPAPAAMLHAGVIKKFGLYGLLRIALPLAPSAAHAWLHILAVLCLGNILYCGWVAMRQRDLNFLLGYSSVAHMGFAFLGLASVSLIGLTGVVVVMIAHGFLAALSFGLGGWLYRQTGTLELAELGGLMRRLPFIGAALLMAMLAGCGLPGFANFVGELLVLFGAWRDYALYVVITAWGALVVGAIYMLRAARQILHGPLPQKWATIQDAESLFRKLPFALLLAALLLFGCAPRLLTDKIEPAAREIVKRLNPGGLAKAANQGSVKTPPHQGAGKKSRNKAKPPPKGANQ